MIRTKIITALVKLNILPSHMLFLYNDKAEDWKSGFGNHATVMYAITKDEKPKIVVEIGSGYGKSTCFIASALKENGFGHLYSIDPHLVTAWNDGDKNDDTYNIVKKLLKKYNLNKFVTQIREFSNEAILKWSNVNKIDMLLIDGSHSYQDVKNDFFGFKDFLKDDALVFFHDSRWKYHKDNEWYREDQGVPQVVQELNDEGFPIITLKNNWGLSILQNSKGGMKLYF